MSPPPDAPGPAPARGAPGPAPLPPLPDDAVVATLGRFTTRYPDSAWLDMLARRASGGESDTDGLVARSREGRLDGTDARDLAWFGFVLAAEPGEHADLDDVADVLGHALAADPPVAARVRGVWLQSLLLTGRLDAGGAGAVGPAEEEVEPEQWWGATTDLLNPYRPGSDPAEDEDAWLAALGRPFTEAGLAPLRLRPGSEPPFERLTTDPLPSSGGDLVTVVMPVHDPGPELLTSVRSVLAQTWRDLEVVLCDDGSTRGLDLLERCADLDPRVRLLRAEQNAGTYSARNLGLAAARGRYVTFQDADDWSHPERVERQVAAMQDAEGVVASVGHTVRATADLLVTALGLRLVAFMLASLMVEREPVLGALGGYDRVRKSGDREFLLRLEARFGPEAVLTLSEPLAVVQLTPGSLSRGDMGFLRRHAARQAYSTAAGAWHREIERGAEDARLEPPQRAPFVAPAYVETGSASRDAGTVDLVLLADPAANATTDLGPVVAALCEGGLRVGVVEFPGPRDACRQPQLPGDRLAALFRSGEARWVLPGEHVHARTALVHDPLSVLTMPATRLREVHVDHLVLVADRASGFETAVGARAAHGGAGRVHWLPASEGVARDVVRAAPGAAVLPPAPWLVHPTVPRPPTPLAEHPVVGLTTGDFADRDARSRWDRAFVPQDEATEVWGFGRLPGRRAGRELTRVGPPDVPWGTFLDRVDYLLAPPLEVPRLTARVLDAWARGTVVLASEELRPFLGEAAEYPGAGGVDAYLARHREDPSRYAAAQERAADWVRRHVTPEGLRSTRASLSRLLDESRPV